MIPKGKRHDVKGLVLSFAKKYMNNRDFIKFSKDVNMIFNLLDEETK